MTLGPKKLPCYKELSRDCIEMSTAEFDLLVLANLDAHRRSSDVPEDPAVNSTRTAIDYYLSEKQICKKMFLFTHGVGAKQYKNLITHYYAVSSRIHGNIK